MRAEVAHEDGASSRRHQALHKPPPRFPPPFVRLHNVTPSAICLWLSGADDSFVHAVHPPVSNESSAVSLIFYFQSDCTILEIESLDDLFKASASAAICSQNPTVFSTPASPLLAAIRPTPLHNLQKFYSRDMGSSKSHVGSVAYSSQ